MQNQPETTPVAPNTNPPTPEPPIPPSAPQPTPVAPDSPAPQTPASTPAEPVAPSNPTPTPAAPTERPKPIRPKSKKKLIAIITSCVVSLALVISGVAFAIIHNLPEKVLLDAVSGFLTAKNIELSGQYRIKSDSEYSQLESVDLDFSGATSGITNTAEVTATMNFKDKKSYSTTIDETFTEDGVLYLKISNLKDTLEQMSKNNDLDYYPEIETYFGDLIGEIDGNWWKISISEIMDGFEDMIPTEVKTKYTKTYNCVLGKIKDAENNKDQYGKLYGENSFVSAERYNASAATKSGLDINNFANSGDLYKVSFDADKLTNFLNGAKDIIDAEGIAACFDETTKVETSDIEREDVEEIIGNLPEIVLSIKGWNHELKGIYLSSKETEPEPTNQTTEVNCNKPDGDEYDAVVNCVPDYSEPQTDYDMYINFNYPASLNVSAPSGTKSITDIIKKAIQTFQTLYIQDLTSGGDDDIIDIDIDTDTDTDTDIDWIIEDDDDGITDDDLYINDTEEDWGDEEEDWSDWNDDWDDEDDE